MKKQELTDKDGEKEFADRTFAGLDLKGAELDSRTFYACVFRNCDLTGAGLRFCKFRECRFESCNLSLARPRGAVFDGTVFKDSKLTGVNWADAAWPKLRLAGPPVFLNCVLSDCGFLGLPLAGAEIKNCLAKEADFREADLAGANLAGARNYAIDVKANKVQDASFSLPEAMSLLYCLDIKIV